jgi:hypothetical protein
MNSTRELKQETTEDDYDDVKSVVNPLVDEKLAFDKKQTKFVRFDGRYFDNEIVFDDHINLLVPPTLEPSNILLFELILL